jgi:H+/Cl- antiporter ClcA
MKTWILRLWLFILLSFLVGSLSSLFLWGLALIQGIPPFLWALPIVAFLLHGLAGFDFSKKGMNYFLGILASVKKTSTFPSHSFLITPYALITTWMSQLAGASVGREGTAVLMGASIGEGLAEKYNEHKGIWIRMGMSAGFASIFGTPLAGCLFALEVGVIGKFHLKSILPCLTAAFLTDWVSRHVWGTNHVSFPPIFMPTISMLFWAKMTCIGLFLGLLGLLYLRSQSIISKSLDKLPVQGPLKAILAGLFLATLLSVSYFSESRGLGSVYLIRPFTEDANAFAYLKLIATSFSLGLGFKGGEATPLFLIGSHAAANLKDIVSLPIGFLSALGFTSLYTGLTKTPLTGMALGYELFGPSAAICYLFVTLVVMYSSGKKGLFTKQTWADWIPKPLY